MTASTVRSRGRSGSSDVERLLFLLTASMQVRGRAPVSEGGLEPPRPIRALAPQASASAYSATRTRCVFSRSTTLVEALSAAVTVAKGRADTRIGLVARNGVRMGEWTATTYAPTTPWVRPGREVVDICRDLIRIDTTNYGDGSGPGERKAAEYVATSARRGRHRGRAVRVRAGPYQRRRPLGRYAGRPRRPAAAPRAPRRRPGRGRRLAGAPVLGRGTRRLPVGPRRGRHEGLRRDAAVRGPGARAGRAAARPADRARASPPTRRRVATRAPSRLVEHRPGPARGLHRGRR